MPFTSTAQITASSGKVFTLLKADAANRGNLIKGTPFDLDGAVSSAPPVLVNTSVQYALGRNSGFLSALTTAPSEYAVRYASSFTALPGPCAYKGADLVECLRTPSPTGVTLWTYAQSAATSATGNRAAIIERFAVVIDP